jgi:uncharacterized RDD family membrane protein YckC
MKYVYAGLWMRISAFALDYLLIAGYLILVVVFSSLVMAFFPSITSRLFANPFSGQLVGFGLVTLPVSLYFVLSESSGAQATWGKRKKQLRVIRTDGTPLRSRQAVYRTALKFIPWELAHTCIWQVSFASPTPSPFIPIGFIIVWVLVGANIISLVTSRTRQTLYDRLSKTYVVTQ